MQVSLTPIPVESYVPTDNQFFVKVGDRTIGKMIEKADTRSYRWHVVLDSAHNINVYQGFGFTPDEAMRDAIHTNRKRRTIELVELDYLENVIWGDHELN